MYGKKIHYGTSKPVNGKLHNNMEPTVETKPLVIIPTYNEKENIREIVRDILGRPFPFSVLIVDDNSPDGTGEIVEDMKKQDSRINVLHREKKMGLGQAYIAGFRWGLENGYGLMFEMDADYSHRPKYLDDFMEAIEDADLVLGSRYSHGVNVIDWPMGRLLLSFYANVYSRIVTGLQIRDLTGGFKCYRREVLEAIDLSKVKSTGYAFQIEMTMRTASKGFRIKEIPIVFYDRSRGTSKMSFHIAYEAAFVVWKLRILKLLGRL
jgi:dolichol-phosphate mannosyltransferase